jgi:AcrR family transcriptional regulator
MNFRHRITADDMRERIISVAEEHFRRIGYAKTAVADIAAALGMSPANIYRFFPSKSAINNAICARLMLEVNTMMAGIVAGEGTAAEKMRAFFIALHRHNKTRLTNEHRLYDMVEVAMAENWPAIDAHCRAMRDYLTRIIAQGIEAGDFRTVDLESFADTACDASAKVIHPTLIAHCARCGDVDQEEQTHRIVDLILSALRP